MKILQLCKKYPFPVRDGESLAVTNLSRALGNIGCEVDLLAMNTAKHFFEGGRRPELLGHYGRVEAVPVDNRVRYRDAFANLFSPRSYHVSRFENADFRRVLRRTLQQASYDIIQLETLYLAPYIRDIRAVTDTPVVMRAHNVESEIWRRIGNQGKVGLRTWYLRYLARKLEHFERRQLKAYDLLVPISGRDARQFAELGHQGPRCVVPIGLEMQRYTPDYDSFRRPLSLGFIGSLDWMPNLDGLMWFLRNIWPGLHRAFPALELNVAGRNTPEWLRRQTLRGVTIHGEVPSAVDFINRHSILLVPLRSGSGMRAKILEGMALGKVVLSTTVGLEGIPAAHRQEVLRADSLEEFQGAIALGLHRNGQFKGMGVRARTFVEERFDSDLIARKLFRAYEELIVQV